MKPQPGYAIGSTEADEKSFTFVDSFIETVRECERMVAAEIEVAADHLMQRHSVAFTRFSLVHYTVTLHADPMFRRGLAVDGVVKFEAGYHREDGNEHVWHLRTMWLDEGLKP